MARADGPSYFDGGKALTECRCDRAVLCDGRDGLGPRCLKCGRSLARRSGVERVERDRAARDAARRAQADAREASSWARERVEDALREMQERTELVIPGQLAFGA